MATTAIDLLAPVYRLSVEQYERMAEAGVFDEGPRVELIDGIVVEVSPQNEPHFTALAWLNKHLVPQLDPAHILMPQLPARMPSLRSMPEPDVWVLEEALIRDAEPFPLLVIEVADSSLGIDHVTKARLYARRGVADYWIVDVRAGAVEVHREPSGERWGERTTHGPDTTLRPLLLPGVEVDVGALLAFAAG